MGKPKITNRPWTDQELAVLKKLWENGVPVDKIAEVLPSRTEYAILNTAGRKKYQRPQPTIDMEKLKKYSKIYEC